MNHLCGLDFIDNRSDDLSWEKSLTEKESKALKDFELLHENDRPEDCKGTKKAPQFVGKFSGEELTSDNGWRELDKITLFRFLCADRLSNGNFQFEKSHDRLRRALQFRKQYNADAILSWWLKRIEHNEEERIFVFASSSLASGALSECGRQINQVQITPTHKVEHPGFSSMDLAKYERLRIRRFTGRDYQGQPVLFERLGAFLGSGNSKHFTLDEWCRFYVWDLERHFVEMRQAAKECKQPINKYTFCGDGQGIVSAILNGSIWKIIPLLKGLVRSVEDFYPELADRIILFNVPKVATVFYRAVRSFMDPVTASKIVLHAGSDYEDVFSKFMSKDAIPVEYGGTSTVEYPITANS